jgi:hypothetical protein
MPESSGHFKDYVASAVVVMKEKLKTLNRSIDDLRLEIDELESTTSILIQMDRPLEKSHNGSEDLNKLPVYDRDKEQDY